MTDQSKTAMVLVPHPDDAEFYAGGFIARLAVEGWRVVIVTATDGRRGSFVETEEDLILKRAEEARLGGKLIGAAEVLLLGYPDGGLDELPPGALRSEFVRLIRQYRPALTISQDPFYPLEDHPDHRACAWAVSDAIGMCYLPLAYPEHMAAGLKTHAVPEKYYYTAPGSPTANRIEDITATIDTRIAALRAHNTQMEFLVQEIIDQASMAGLNPDDLLSMFGGDRGEAMGWFIRQEAAETGKLAGFEYGEAYHYDRYHPAIEMVLSQMGNPAAGAKQ